MKPRFICVYGHSFRFPRFRRRGLLWPRLTLGWWSIEFLPGCMSERIDKMLATLFGVEWRRPT